MTLFPFSDGAAAEAAAAPRELELTHVFEVTDQLPDEVKLRELSALLGDELHAIDKFNSTSAERRSEFAAHSVLTEVAEKFPSDGYERVRVALVRMKQMCVVAEVMDKADPKELTPVLINKLSTRLGKPELQRLGAFVGLKPSRVIYLTKTRTIFDLVNDYLVDWFDKQGDYEAAWGQLTSALKEMQENRVRATLDKSE